MRRSLSVDEQIDRQARQVYYAAVSRQIGLIAGALLLILADRSRRRADRHLATLAASTAVLQAEIAGLPDRIERALLRGICDRLNVLRARLDHRPPQLALSDSDIGAALDELQACRARLLDAGRHRCQFEMVHFAAGCCCGQHADALPGTATSAAS